jgi:hypothetical protein
MAAKKLTHRPVHEAPSAHDAFRSLTKEMCQAAAATGSIRQELGGMGDSIDRLAKSIDALKERLRPVSQDRGPGGAECDGPRPTLCEIGEDIRSRVGNIDCLRQQVESMTAELDI